MRWTHWAESAEQNKSVIGEAIAPYLKSAQTVLEIGSGTGQHAVHLAEQHPHLSWQPSEHPSNLSMLKENLQQHGLSNIRAPQVLDANAAQWPELEADLVYSANTLHIMSWASVCQLFQHLGKIPTAEQYVLFYGPFRFDDRDFAPSNEAFDHWLKQYDPQSGIRDISALEEQGKSIGLALVKAIEMPANNHILVWKRST